MTWPSRYGWKFVGRAAVVIGLVFAALVSSWVGIEVERHGKEVVTEASPLARRIFDSSLRAYELEALQDQFLHQALRAHPARIDPGMAARYAGTLAALRHEVEAIDQASLEGRDRTVAVPREAAVA